MRQNARSCFELGLRHLHSLFLISALYRSTLICLLMVTH